MQVAIIGSGVAGLVAGWRLHAHHAVTLFEADSRIGGHVHTVEVARDATRLARPGEADALAVDTGFIVHNPVNYPVLCRIFAELGVATRDTGMSFSVVCERTGLCWAGRDLSTVFAQRRNLLRPRFWGMLRGIARFHAAARAELLDDGVGAVDEDLGLGAFLDRHRIPAATIEHYLVPIGAAIWSAPPEAMRRFPARRFARFLHHHGMLSMGDARPQWRTVVGGARTYVEAITRPWRDRIRTGAPVQRIQRDAEGVRLHVGGTWQRFDRVVIACHSDTALAMLDDPSDAERAILSAIPYQENLAELHTDARLLPPLRRCWSAWNHRVDGSGKRAIETYWMNALQGLDSGRRQLCVSLNAGARIDPASALMRTTYHHPQFLPGSQRAQAGRTNISGVRGTHYCGAWWGQGFHEDGAVSGMAAADEILR